MPTWHCLATSSELHHKLGGKLQLWLCVPATSTCRTKTKNIWRNISASNQQQLGDWRTDYWLAKVCLLYKPSAGVLWSHDKHTKCEDPCMRIYISIYFISFWDIFGGTMRHLSLAKTIQLSQMLVWNCLVNYSNILKRSSLLQVQLSGSGRGGVLFPWLE